MKGAWPKVTASVRRVFRAEHSLPEIGVPERHSHRYIVVAGWKHEINQTLNGCTKPLQDMEPDLDVCIDQLSGSYLNDVLPFHPTAEIMAWWILANIGRTDIRDCSGMWQFVEVHCYKGFIARAVRADATQEILRMFRK